MPGLRIICTGRDCLLLMPVSCAAGVLEATQGSWFYFHRTVLLILLSEAVWMVITHLLVHTWRQPRFAASSAVGYSGVIFGWMTILQLYNPSFAIPLPLGLNLPIAVAPFISLFITQLIVPQASFLGHLAGIIAGYPIGLGWLVRHRCTSMELPLVAHPFSLPAVTPSAAVISCLAAHCRTRLAGIGFTRRCCTSLQSCWCR